MPAVKLEQYHALVEPYLTRLYRTAFRLTGHAADAEDLVQDSCVRAWESLPDPVDPERFEHWLLRVLFHRFIDGVRHQRVVPMESLEGADGQTVDIESPAAGPEELAHQADSERALDAAWAKLDKTQQVLLSLRAEGYGLAEIAAITGISRNVLRARLQRARRSLARHLGAPRSGNETCVRLGRGR